MNKILKRWLSDSFIIATIPMLGYVIALSHEYGYANYFDYPISMIKVSLEMTLLSSLAAVFYFVLLYYSLNFILPYRNKSSILNIFLKKSFPYSIILIIAIFASGFDLVLIKTFIVLILFSAVTTLIYLWKNKKNRENIVEEKYSSKYKNLGDVDVGTIFVLLIIILGISMGSGSVAAKTKNNYYVFKNIDKSYILIAIYEDRIIAAPYDIEKNEYIKEYSTFNLSSDNIHKLKRIEKPRQK